MRVSMCGCMYIYIEILITKKGKYFVVSKQLLIWYKEFWSLAS